MYSLHVPRYVKHVALSFWSFKINFFRIIVGRKTSYWDIRTLHEIWILKPTVPGEIFCGVRLYSVWLLE